MDMQLRQQEIDIWDMFWAICLKWRAILAGALICAILAGGYSYVNSAMNKKKQQDKVQLEHVLTDAEFVQANLYLNYEQACNQQIEYNNQSIRMNLNPNGFYKGNITFFVDNHYSVEYPLVDKVNNISGIIQAYENILYDKIFRNELVLAGVFEENNVEYLEEMVNCNASDLEQQDENLLSINIYSQDIEVCKKIIAILEEQIVARTSNIQELLGEHNIFLVQKSCNLTADSELLIFQRANIERVNTYLNEKTKLYNSLSENAKNYVDMQGSIRTQEKETSNVNDNTVVVQKIPEFSWKMVIIGFVSGAMIVVLIYAVVYILNTRLRIEDDFETIYGVKLLGNVVTDTDKKKTWFGFVDRFIEKLRHRNKRYFPEAEAVEMSAAGIRIAAKKANIQQVYITGNVMLEKENAIAQKLVDILKKDAIEVIVGKPILYDAEALEENAEIGNVILLETSGGSLYNEIGAEIQTCTHQDVNILGAIVVA